MLLLLQYTLIFASVLLLVALGGCFSEHSGVINIGLEGIMVMGALGGALMMKFLPAGTSAFLVVLLTVLASILLGLIYSLLLAVAAVNFKADQTLVGTAMNLLGTAAATVFVKAMNTAADPDNVSSTIQYLDGRKAFLVDIGGFEFNWCMLLAAYPVFADVCRLMGKISAFQDEITLARLRQSLFDEWGERTTLLHSLDKLMATFKELEAVTCDRPGRYRVRPRCVSNPAVAAFMVYTMMLVDNGGYYTLADIHASAYFFPFQYRVETELLFSDSRFAIQQFGGELSVSLSE